MNPGKYWSWTLSWVVSTQLMYLHLGILWMHCKSFQVFEHCGDWGGRWMVQRQKGPILSVEDVLVLDGKRTPVPDFSSSMDPWELYVSCNFACPIVLTCYRFLCCCIDLYCTIKPIAMDVSFDMIPLHSHSFACKVSSVCISRGLWPLCWAWEKPRKLKTIMRRCCDRDLGHGASTTGIQKLNLYTG